MAGLGKVSEVAVELKRVASPRQGNFWRNVGEDVKRSDVLGCLIDP